MPDIDIKDDEFAVMQQILQQQLPKTAKVWVFGSRARKTAKPFSDLDLAIDNVGQALTLSQESALQEAFTESSLPFRVDVVDLNSISDGFREIIEAERIEVR